MKKRWSMRKLLGVIIMMALCIHPVSADEGVQGDQMDAKYLSKVTSDSYFERAGWRLMHGAINIVASPTHLILKPMHAAKCDKCGKNVLLGVGEGVLSTAKFAVLGAWDVVTFWVPGQAGKDIAVRECAMKEFKACCS